MTFFTLLAVLRGTEYGRIPFLEDFVTQTLSLIGLDVSKILSKNNLKLLRLRDK